MVQRKFYEDEKDGWGCQDVEEKNVVIEIGDRRSTISLVFRRESQNSHSPFTDTHLHE